MSKTIVGLFKNTAAAQEVKQILTNNGYNASDVKIVATDSDDYSTGYEGSDKSDEGIGNKISNFFHGLSGGDEHAHSHYARGVNEGGALLTVTTADQDAEEMATLLKQHGATEIEGGYSTSTDSGSYDRSGSTQEITGQTAIPIVEEELAVGKRQVDRGGVRVYSHVVETPVQTEVNLHEERINVDRRAVNRPATAADFETGNRNNFELRAMGEEAVVGKTSRVVEEVLIGKQGTDRTESINDSVRRTEVEVERIPGEYVEQSTK